MNYAAAPSTAMPGFEGVHVHPGWATASETILASLGREMVTWRGNRPVILTGFSMGGAVSGHIAYLLLKANPAYPIRLISFGAPRYATDDFRTAFNRFAAGKDFRAFSTEFPEDPKRLMWPDTYAYYTRIRFTVDRVPQAIDFSCRDAPSLSPCCSGAHDHARYEHVAEKRLGSPTEWSDSDCPDEVAAQLR